MSERKLRTVKEIVDSIAVVPGNEEDREQERINLDLRKLDIRILKSTRDVVNELQGLGLNKASAVTFLMDAGCVIFHSLKSTIKERISEIATD